MRGRTECQIISIKRAISGIEAAPADWNPPKGKIWNRTANVLTRTAPSAKPGMAYPTKISTDVALSTVVRCLMAFNMPSGMQITQVKKAVTNP